MADIPIVSFAIFCPEEENLFHRSLLSLLHDFPVTSFHTVHNLLGSNLTYSHIIFACQSAIPLESFKSIRSTWPLAYIIHVLGDEICLSEESSANYAYLGIAPMSLGWIHSHLREILRFAGAQFHSPYIE